MLGVRVPCLSSSSEATANVDGAKFKGTGFCGTQGREEMRAQSFYEAK
jgi:hypothetical protein